MFACLVIITACPLSILVLYWQPLSSLMKESFILCTEWFKEGQIGMTSGRQSVQIGVYSLYHGILGVSRRHIGLDQDNWFRG